MERASAWRRAFSSIVASLFSSSTHSPAVARSPWFTAVANP
jgi:hypothetical protein